MRIAIFAILIALLLATLTGWRYWDHLADGAVMDQLLAMQPDAPKAFQRTMISGLSEPVQRYFSFAIGEGTPLLPVAELEMTGLFSLGDKAQPNYMRMQAHQVLAAPNGFVWKMKVQSGHLGLSGSDSTSWTRFWMGGLLPVAREGGDADHARSAFGRMVAEAVFWSPAAILPRPNITWQSTGPDTIKVTVRHAGMVQSVDILVAADGQPSSVSFIRWSDANPQGKYQEQAFGGYLSKFRTVQGYQVPMHVEAGNFFGTDGYFPFFIVDVSKISYP